MSPPLTDSFLYKEIAQQPDCLTELLDHERGSVNTLAQAIRDRDITNVVIAARGTSDNAGRYAQYLLGAINGLPVALTTPSLFTIYERPPRFAPNTLVLGISQSGKSPDIVRVLEEARGQGQLTAALTNVADSPLAQQADYTIPLHAGDERSIAATKTYTTELLAVAMLSAALTESAEAESALQQIPRQVAETLTANEGIAQIAERYRYAINCVVIGRGYNYATAFEIALKLKELTYTVAEPYSSADFLHGPLALVEQGFPALVVAPSGRMLPEMLDFVAQLNEREAEIIAITDSDDLASLAFHRLTLTKGAPEWLSPILSVVPGQLFAMHLAYTRNYDPDHPRGLKKVTETR